MPWVTGVMMRQSLFMRNGLLKEKRKKYYSPMMSPEQVSIVVIGQDMIDNNLKKLVFGNAKNIS